MKGPQDANDPLIASLGDSVPDVQRNLIGWGSGSPVLPLELPMHLIDLRQWNVI